MRLNLLNPLKSIFVSGSFKIYNNLNENCLILSAGIKGLQFRSSTTSKHSPFSVEGIEYLNLKNRKFKNW